MLISTERSTDSNKKYFLFFVLLSMMFFDFQYFAEANQERKEQISNDRIVKQKSRIQKKIKEIERILDKINKNKSNSLGKLNAISLKIKSNKKLININSYQIELLNNNITRTEKEIKKIEIKLEKLNQEYSTNIYNGFKILISMNKILFILSAKSYNEMILRAKYLSQYSRSRKNYIHKISMVKKNLQYYRNNFFKKKKKLDKLQADNNEQKKKLLETLSIERKTITDLSKQSDKLKKDLEEQNKSMKEINSLLMRSMDKDDDLYLEELDTIDLNTMKKKKGIDKYSKPLPAPKISPSKKKLYKAINSLFVKNKGKLPWPVKRGFISRKYGKYSHPILKNVKVDNNGIDIQTNKGEKVYAIFNGVVKIVAFVPGMQTVVIVKHGNYHTVYARLKSACVKEGTVLKTMDQIGEVYTDATNGISEVQFQVRKGIHTYPMNPIHWIRKR